VLALDALQRRMTAAIAGGHDSAVFDLIEDVGIAPAARLQIYRNHAAITLTEALRATFPVVCKLVDERFFAFAAYAYICETFPSEPRLSAYGASFPLFLRAFPPAQALRYLSDVARLEWEINAALHADAATPVPRSTLAAISLRDAPRLMVHLHPSLRLLTSPWPIERIWSANQPGADPHVTIDPSAEVSRLQIYRRIDRVVIESIDAPTFAFLHALLRDGRLEDAAEAALRVDLMFDVSVALGLLLEEGLIVGWHLAPAPAASSTTLKEKVAMLAQVAGFRSRTGLVEHLKDALDLLGRFPLSILQFIMRFSIASVFWHAGLTKIASWDTTIALFHDEYMVPLLPPELAASMAATVELTCPVLLVLGIATRLATLPMLGMTFVIGVFVYPELWTEHLMWAAILLFILTRGPGALSLDRFAARALFDRKGV